MQLVTHRASTSGFALKIMIGVANLGCLMSYMNTIGTLGSEVFTEWNVHMFLSSYAGFMIVFVGIIELPLIMIRSYGELNIISYLSLVFIIFTVFFVAIGTSSTRTHGRTQTNTHEHAHTRTHARTRIHARTHARARTHE